MTALVLVEGQDVSEEALGGIGLGNAKQLVIGHAPGMGVVLHVEATSSEDLQNALLAFAEVPEVAGVLTLALRNP